MTRIAAIARELGADDVAADAHTEQRRLEEARFFVACVGQFKRGKSTLINALVGQSVLPVGVVPVTSVVTILRYAERPAALVHFSDGHRESVAVEDVGAFIDERRNPENERGAIVVEIGLPSPILGRRALTELDMQEDAVRKPVTDTEDRVTRLTTALRELDRSLLDLRFLFDAVEAELGSTFEQHRLRFVQESGPELQRRLIEWVEARRDRNETALRSKAMDQARDLVAHAIHAWLVAIEPDANALYCTATERFLRLANAHISRLAADAGSLEIEDLPSELGFHTRRQFYFTNLMHAAAGSPVTWAIDRLAPLSVRQEHVARASAAYLAHLLDSNSHRVENDFLDRTQESRRWLEAQIRKGLVSALHSAERALSIAVESQHMSEAQVCHRLDHLASLRAELVALVSFAS